MISVYLLLDCHYKGRNTSEVGNSICFSGFSSGFIGNFLGFIGARIADIENFSGPES